MPTIYPGHEHGFRFIMHRTAVLFETPTLSPSQVLFEGVLDFAAWQFCLSKSLRRLCILAIHATVIIWVSLDLHYVAIITCGGARQVEQPDNRAVTLSG